MQNCLKYFSYLIVCVPSLLMADRILETDWLEDKPGSSGEVLGAEVVSVDSEEGTTVVEVTIPVDNVDEIETIEVIAKQDNQPIEQPKEPQWLRDYEKGIYGIRLYLNVLPGFEFRLRLDDGSQSQ